MKYKYHKTILILLVILYFTLFLIELFSSVKSFTLSFLLLIILLIYFTVLIDIRRSIIDAKEYVLNEEKTSQKETPLTVKERFNLIETQYEKKRSISIFLFESLLVALVIFFIISLIGKY